MDTRADTITVTVDGKEISCRQGELLIEVAKRAGVYIPFFCYHPRMDPVGACRMCLVHIEGAPPKPQTSCTTRVSDGMVVQTQFTNPDIRTAQQGMLEFLLINHPLDCPICDRGGECPLQDQTQDYGPAESRYVEPKRRFPKPVPISSLVMLDRERCILCYRCTRFCEELSGDTLIAVMERGPSSYIYPFEGEDFDSYFSGNTVQICPVGALTSTEYRFEARPWDLRYTPSTCNMCASGCSIDISTRVQDGKVVRFSARTNDDTNEDWLCDKGRYGHAYISSPQRLTQPHVRAPDGLKPASWDDAFRALRDRLGPPVDGSRAALVCGGSLYDEDAYTAQKFARLVLRTNNVDHRLEGGNGLPPVPSDVTYADLVGASHVVLVSLDAREELPLVFLRLRIAATKRGVRVTVVHPRAAAAKGLPAAHVAHLPGTDAELAAAVAAALGSPIAGGVEALAAACGVASADVRALAESLRTDGTVILLGPRAAASGALEAWRRAGAASGARVGWAPRRAGEYGALQAGVHPVALPGWRLVMQPQHRSEIETAWGTAVPDAPGLSAVDALRNARDGDLDVLWLVGADVLRDVPDARLGAEALAAARFVVVQDVLESPLLDHADVVLPAAAFTERSGTLTDWEGRRQPAQQAVEPPGAARADYAILAEAARQLDAPIGCRRLADVQSELDALWRPPASAPDPTGGFLFAAGPADPDRPLRLLSYRLLYDAGSRASVTKGIAAHTPAAFAELHPDDAAGLGVEDGAAVRVSTAHGTLTVPARVTTHIRPGVVFVPYLQPDASARELLSVDDPAPAAKVERA